MARRQDCPDLQISQLVGLIVLEVNIRFLENGHVILDMVHVEVGCENILELEIVFSDVGDERVDGSADVDEGHIFPLCVIQEIAVGLDRPSHLVKDDEFAQVTTGDYEDRQPV
jgi:hypothetical protein